MGHGATPLTRLRAWQLVLLVAACYAVLARIGEAILPLDGIAALWPASGFAAVMVLWAQTRTRRVLVLVAIVLGIGISIAIRGMLFTNELGFLVGNLVEPVVMLPFLVRATTPTGRMTRLAHVGWLCGGAAVATAVSAACVAVLATWSFDGSFDPGSTLYPTWLSFMTGDLLGMLLVTPVMLQLTPPSRLWSRGSAVEQIVLWALLVASLLSCLIDPVAAGVGMLVVIVMALRLDTSAAMVAVLAVSSALVFAFLEGTVVIGLAGVSVIDVRLVIPLMAVVAQTVAFSTMERLSATEVAVVERERALRSNRTLDAVLKTVPVGIALYDADVTEAEGQPRFALNFLNVYGASGSSAVAGEAPGADRHMPIETAAFYDHLRDAWASGSSQAFVIQEPVDTQPVPRVFSASVTPIGNDQLLVEWTDVTELVDARQAAEAAAAEAQASRQTLRHALDSGLDAFAIYEKVTDRWQLLFVNTAGASRSGSTAEALVGAPPELVIPVEAVDQIVPLMDVAQASGKTQRTIADLTGSRTGWHGDFDVAVTPTAESRVVVTWRDVSELQNAYRTMRSAHAAAMHAATHDALTNLPNRPLVLDRISTAIAALPRTHDGLAVMYIDVDNFKALNDRHGHAFGDAVLISVARRLKQLTRDGDTAARIAGDEFVLVLTGLDATWDSVAFHERITSVMAAPIERNGVSINVSLSVGVAVTDGSPITPDQILDHADVALFASKRLGLGRLTVYEPGLRRKGGEAQPTAQELLAGLAEGQFVNAYQEVIDAKSDVVVGREALVRWQHPRLGMLTPGQFLDLAESTGAIAELGREVLHRAIRDLGGRQSREWVSVNLAPTQMLRSNVAADVESWCGEAGIAASRVVLEVTETQLLDATPTVLRQLTHLRDIGCRIAIDDFGTGYSSIAYLESFDVDIIKIDQGMLSGEMTDRKSALVTWIVQLAKTLDCITIAEGIETLDQRELVLRSGVDLMQGYLWGRPRFYEGGADLHGPGSAAVSPLGG